MQSIGMDIHLKHINACIRDDAGQIKLERKFKTEPEFMDRFLVNQVFVSFVLEHFRQAFQQIFSLHHLFFEGFLYGFSGLFC